MKKYALAIAIASCALFGLSAQAAPVSSAMSGVQNQVTGDAVQVWHCRHWSGHCGGWHYRHHYWRRHHWRHHWRHHHHHW